MTRENITKNGHSDSDRARIFALRERYGDVTFELDCGTRLKASKIVMACACEHFDTMFSGNFAEARSNVIRIREVSSEAFHLFIKYCFLGEIEMFYGKRSVMYAEVHTRSTLAELLPLFEFMRICERFGLPDINDQMVHLFSEKMRTDDFIATSTLAYAYDSGCVAEEWLDIVSDLFKQLTNSGDFFELDCLRDCLRECTRYHEELFKTIVHHRASSWTTHA